MKSFAMIVLLLTTLTGCSVINSINDYINENPVLVNIATNQTVVRYIEAAETVDKKRARAEDFERRANKVLSFIDGNPETTVDGLLSIIDSAVDWQGLSIPDRILVSDIIALIEVELRKYEGRQDFSNKTKFALRELFVVAIQAARLYL